MNKYSEIGFVVLIAILLIAFIVTSKQPIAQLDTAEQVLMQKGFIQVIFHGTPIWIKATEVPKLADSAIEK